MEFETIRGESVPAVGLGTWRMDERTARSTVETAIEMGYRHIDTAQLYGNEAGVGRAIAAAGVPRDELFVTTKVNPWKRHYDTMVASVEDSLRALGIDVIDLLLIHWPNPLSDLETVMAALNEARERGYTRHIGVSNFGVDRLERARELSEAPIVTDQVQFHPFWPQRSLLEYCQRESIILTGYSPLAQGGVLTDSLIQEMGQRYGKSPAQVAIRWAIQHENVITIPKSTSPPHLADNLEVFDFDLTESEMERLTRPSKLRTGLSWVRGRLGV